MRTFFGGQINQECRGELAVIISREQLPDQKKGEYGVFVYPVASEEFTFLTGVGSRKNIPERVYIGVSSAIGCLITGRVADISRGHLDFRSIDELVVQPTFLNENLEKPEKIILVSTRNGYEVE